MVGRPRADPEQKQDFGGKTVTQGIDTQQPITEALLYVCLMGFSPAALAPIENGDQCNRNHRKCGDDRVQ
jgi:hypothetical protein